MGKKRKPFNFGGIVLLAFVGAAAVLSLAACSSSTESEPDIFFTVYFETSGGIPVPEKLTVLAGSTIEPPEDAINLKGFSLNGWCRDEDCAEAWDFENDTVTKDVILYAFWKPSKTGGGGGGGRGGSVAAEPEDDGTSTGTPAGGTITTTPGGTTTGTGTTKEDPTVNWPSSLSAFEDDTLAIITLPGNGAGTPGSFAWAAPGTILVGSSSPQPFNMIFTPTDTSSFNTMTQNVNVAVLYPNGTASRPFKVSSADMLSKIGSGEVVNGYPWTMEAHYKQTGDIPLSGKFTPIGTDSNPFTGFYDGGGNAITGLDVGTSGIQYQGLFGYIVGNIPGAGAATIKNVNLDGGSVTGAQNVGSIVGFLNYGIVEDCQSSATVTGTAYSYLGGIVGNSGANSTVKGCGFTGSVSSVGNNVGGVVGNNGLNSKVENCYSTGTVSGVDNVGGVVGSSSGTGNLLQNSYSTGKVEGNNQVGGVVGQISYGTVANCYSTGKVEGSKNVGGVAGQNTNGTVKYCYATSIVGITTSTNVAGIVGVNAGGEEDYCVALNPSVTGASSYGRVTGTTVGTRIGCYVYSDMKVNGSIITTGLGATTMQGANITPLGEEENKSWWKTTGVNWSSVWGGDDTDDDHPWKWDGNEKRPKLYFEQ